MFKILHLSLPLYLRFSQLFSGFALLVFADLHECLALVLALLFQLVEEFAALCELHLADQVIDATGVQLSKDCLYQLLRQVLPVHHLLGHLGRLAALGSSVGLRQVEELGDLLRDEAYLLWQVFEQIALTRLEDLDLE